MTTTSGGNLSIREENGDIWITPARLDKGSLRREDIVCVHADGTVTGPNRPSSELPFHQEIYRTRHDIRGIVHAHPGGAGGIQPGAPDSRYAALPPGAAGLRRGGLCALRTAGQPCARAQCGGTFRTGLRLRAAGESRRGDRRRQFAGGLPPLRDAGVYGEDHHQGAHAGRGAISHRRGDRDGARCGSRVDGVPWPRSRQPRKGTARAPGRVRAPRLPSAAVHQHAGQFFGPRGPERVS